MVNPLSRLERITDITGPVNPLQTGDVHFECAQLPTKAWCRNECRNFLGFLLGKLVRKMDVRNFKPFLFPSDDFHAQLLPIPSDKV